MFAEIDTRRVQPLTAPSPHRSGLLDKMDVLLDEDVLLGKR